MAIRDRVTVVTKQGQTPTLEVDKQGGSIDISYPDRGTPWLRVFVYDKNRNPTREELRVAESEIVSIRVDTAPKVSKKRSAT